MSGWIKFEKDLLTDPRTFRIAQKLAAAWEVVPTLGEGRFVSGSRNAAPLPGVTVVLGGLVTLWALADTHIGKDDILPLGVDEINQLVGLKGFCEVLPADWLQVVDAHSVKLPNYHDHNGTTAKERALTQRRVERHRKALTVERYKKSTKGNGQSLPDQDLEKTIHTRARAKPRASVCVPRETEIPDATRKAFAKAMAVYPTGTWRDDDRERAEIHFAACVEAGTDIADLIAASAAYGLQQQAMGRAGSQFVMSPARFFGTEAWRGPFDLPQASDPAAANLTARKARDAEALAAAVAHAESIGCPLRPRDAERDCPDAYRTRVQTWAAGEGRAAPRVGTVAALLRAGGGS